MTARGGAAPRRLRLAALAGVCLLALGAGHAAHAADAAASADAVAKPSPDITPAEQLVFTTDHMRGIAPQTELDYAIVATGSEAPGNARGGSPGAANGSDVVHVLVTSAGNSKSDAQVSDHSGAVTLPTEGMPCNPVILYFLERDISEMSALTGGQRRYFQKRLRLALAEGPKITPAMSRIGGKSVAVRRIVVQPYLHDPNAQRFARYTGKRYTFEIADALPGQVAQIRTEVPGSNGDFAHPLRTETLTFQAAVRKLGGAASAPAATPTAVPSASR
ncbi:hypothetical protein [Trinickia sp. Y13]|uniref:hypothetical protein n=1 Tax=Trinickia sp. Y13 TaxID=2917807 RepID=UPI002406EFF4|nr:hypothetical protein [Trinickia sp. Y13]MDG0023877.1 hypothetical protein [Trinickia sp. Y13]